MDIRYPERMTELLPDLHVARDAFREKPAEGDLGETAMEIWYRPNRDAPQTAMSKLYTAIHEYHANANCIHSSCAVVGNLFCDDWPNGSDWHGESDTYFAIVLAAHDDVIDRDA